MGGGDGFFLTPHPVKNSLNPYGAGIPAGLYSETKPMAAITSTSLVLLIETYPSIEIIR
jgi:hypothetical protein